MRSHVLSALPVFLLAVIAACGGQPGALSPSQPPPSASPAGVARPYSEPVPIPPPPPPKPAWSDLAMQFAASTAAAINDRDAKKYAECFTEDAVLTAYGEHELEGRDAIRAEMDAVIDGFVDLRVSGSRIFVKNDVIVGEWVLGGTHKGEFAGIKPTGKPMGVRGAWVVWLNPAGLATKAHRFLDVSTIMGQLGQTKHEERPVAAPPMGQPELKGVKGLPDEEKNIEIAKGFYAAVEKKSDADFVVAMADSVAWTDLTAPKDFVGKDEVKAAFQSFIKAFPDAKSTPQSQWVVEDQVITEAVMTGTHTGPLGKIKPTNKPVVLRTLDIMQFRDGKIVRVVTYGNHMDLQAQLGLLPKPKAGKDKPKK
jgi:steroid delta-isomerase-like uncharacterized protein/uncharacterized protein (TIGR02246 family)